MTDSPIVQIQPLGGSQIVKTVAQTDHLLCARGFKIVVQPLQRRAGFIRRQERASTPRHALGFAEMQIRDAQQGLIRPIKRTRRQGVKRGFSKAKGEH